MGPEVASKEPSFLVVNRSWQYLFYIAYGYQVKVIISDSLVEIRNILLFEQILINYSICVLPLIFHLGKNLQQQQNLLVLSLNQLLEKRFVQRHDVVPTNDSKSPLVVQRSALHLLHQSLVSTKVFLHHQSLLLVFRLNQLTLLELSACLHQHIPSRVQLLLKFDHRFDTLSQH